MSPRIVAEWIMMVVLAAALTWAAIVLLGETP